MIIEGTITTIHEKETYPNCIKQYITVVSNTNGKAYKLLLFNRSELIEGYHEGERVKVVYSSKEFKGKEVFYVNAIERANAQRPTPEREILQSPEPEPTPEQVTFVELYESFDESLKVNFLEAFYELSKTNNLPEGHTVNRYSIVEAFRHYLNRGFSLKAIAASFKALRGNTLTCIADLYKALEIESKDPLEKV